jgi:cobalamin biosynthesis Mg chelatase CobN
VQLYNASEIMNMTEISVTDNIRNLDEEVNEMMKTQIAAGVFVFGMVIVASLTVTIFCIYTHVKDKFSPKRAPSGGRSHKNAEAGDVFLPFRPSTSTTLV